MDEKLSLLGYCTEFNVVGGIIQNYSSVPCNEIFPKCDRVYHSSDAYKCTLIDTHKYIYYISGGLFLFVTSIFVLPP